MAESDLGQIPDAKWGGLAALYAVPVLILFACFGDLARGFTAWICTGLVIGVVRSYWILKRRPWFWVTIAILASLQVPLVIFFPTPMTRNFTIWALFPVAIVDFFIMYGSVKMIAKTV